MAQMEFFDLWNRYATLDAKREKLVGIDALVQWDEFRPLFTAIWRKPPAARQSLAGRKPWDVVTLFKTLVVSALYDLAADQVVHAVSGPRARGPCPGCENCVALPGGDGDGQPGRGVLQPLRRRCRAPRLDGAGRGQILDVERARATGSSVSAWDRAGAAQPQPFRRVETSPR